VPPIGGRYVVTASVLTALSPPRAIQKPRSRVRTVGPLENALALDLLDRRGIGACGVPTRVRAATMSDILVGVDQYSRDIVADR
jgi:hypothetical protein